MLISDEEFLKKLEKSGLSPKEILQLYWSMIYCIIPAITDHALTDEDRVIQDKIQRNSLKKINRNVLSKRIRDILAELEETDLDTHLQCQQKKHHSHSQADFIWNNKVKYLKKLLRFDFSPNSQEIKDLKSKLDDYLRNLGLTEKKEDVLNSVKKEGRVKADFNPPENSSEKYKHSTTAWKWKKPLTIASIIGAGATSAWIIYNLTKKKGTDPPKK